MRVSFDIDRTKLHGAAYVDTYYYTFDPDTMTIQSHRNGKKYSLASNLWVENRLSEEFWDWLPEL
jgi:hypothetical protein